jgi:hypothetical protein
MLADGFLVRHQQQALFLKWVNYALPLGLLVMAYKKAKNHTKPTV